MKDLLRKKIEYLKAHPRVDVAYLLIGLGIFALITLLNVSHASIWFDEAFTAYISQFSFGDIAKYTSTDVHPPFYYWLIKLWSMMFGTNELAFRSLSIVFGAGVVTTAVLLTRKFFGRLVAGVALLFLVLSPMLIRYSDEARMYTLAAFIILIATHVLVKATETNKRWLWIVYGALVALGMWTHYFTALAWLAHWGWRAIVTRKSTNKPKLFWKKFFSKNFIIAHVVAIVLFLPWLPFMYAQLTGIQGTGFWIGAVGIDSVVNYFTNVFYYLEHNQVTGWAALLVWLVLGGLAVLSFRVYRGFNKTLKLQYLVVCALAFFPVIFLFIASLPPLHPSFVERYLLPAVVGFTIFMAVTIVVGTRRWKPLLRVGSVLIIVGMMVFGIYNVYLYGNYNKNSGTHILTRELVQKIDSEAKPGEPIIANSPWIFYEAVFYNTTNHPVYFIDEDTEYIYGSLDMLKDGSMHKITDVSAFTKEHPTVWYIGVSDNDITSTRSSWHKVKDISVTSWVDGKTMYRGAEFTVN
ncbi:MAG: rane protein of unknown function [Candidatus Saccharibacteria bacterium]|nr:rane protein of unknown function [Candidatus Saccharibacteria bacterium]